MITETLRDKLRKVLALAQSGEAGERDAAKNLLDKLLKENNLTMADIQDNEKEKTWLKVGRHKWMKELMIQIYCRVTNESSIVYWEYEDELAFEITKVQAAEMQELYSVFAPALKKELKRARKMTIDAFCLKNSICSTGTKGNDPKEFSPDELREMMAIAAFADRMEKTPIYRQIQG